MKITAISDTHGLHASLSLPGGDVLLHSGDVSMRGKENEIKEFLDWFTRQPYTHKIFIAGNHDFYFEENSDAQIKSIIPKNIIYLNDSGVVINNISIWGSPVTPWFLDWAFNRHRGKEIQYHWDLIPEGTQILITHGPPAGILDLSVKNQHLGCEQLLQRIEKIRPQYHLFGHIHEAYGQQVHGATTHINSSVLDEKYRMVHAPVYLEID